MKAQIRGNPAMTIIVAYAPTEIAKEKEKDAYSYQQRSAIKSVPLHDFLAILTDANARLGLDKVLHSYNPTTNDNGQRHIDVYQLLAANTLFKKRKGKLWT